MAAEHLLSISALNKQEVKAGQLSGFRNQPMFSVVTVCLNAGSKLAETVRSILGQSFEDYEIIVKDGGSYDGSLVGLPQATKIKLIVSDDTGIYDAMNQGLSHCTGQYVLFLNAGDRLASMGVLAKVYSIATKSSPVLIYGNYYNDEYKNIVRSPARLTKRLLFRNMLCHQACFIRRSVLVTSGGFDTTFSLMGDYDMLAKILIRQSLSYQHIDHIVSNYRGGGISRSPEGLRTCRCEMDIIRHRYYNRWEQHYYYYAYLLTLPSLRNWLMTSSHCKRIWPLYVSFINAYNNVLYGSICAKKRHRQL